MQEFWEKTYSLKSLNNTHVRVTFWNFTVSNLDELITGLVYNNC